MSKQVLSIAAGALTALIVAGPAAAQTPPSTGGSPPQISPIRVEFTRPGGTPGSARSLTASQSEFMIAPGQPQTGATKKKKP